ncbi:hypothetical protein AU195_18285 [Mycobacterium sp. IS-1496]|nr:hypothetical protein AU195_18285 [Mycobacterium sp. IS-1496]
MDTPASTGGGTPPSRQVNWYETFRYAAHVAAQRGVALDHRELPIAGTLQWCGMADTDARKLLSLILGGVREAITNDARQDAVRDAGEAVWEGEDWSDAARQLLRRREIDDLRNAS